MNKVKREEKRETERERESKRVKLKYETRERIESRDKHTEMEQQKKNNPHKRHTHISKQPPVYHYYYYYYTHYYYFFLFCIFIIHSFALRFSRFSRCFLENQYLHTRIIYTDFQQPKERRKKTERKNSQKSFSLDFLFFFLQINCMQLHKIVLASF